MITKKFPSDASFMSNNSQRSSLPESFTLDTFPENKFSTEGFSLWRILPAQFLWTIPSTELFDSNFGKNLDIRQNLILFKLDDLSQKTLFLYKLKLGSLRLLT